MSNPYETLEADVKARNRANAYAHQLYKDLVEVFTPLVGQNILKKDGTLRKFVKLPDFPNSQTDLMVYKDIGDYSLAFVVKTKEPCGEFSYLYREAVVYVGSLQDGVLVELSSPFTGRTDYTVQEIESKRQVYKAAKKIADDARDDLFPFGE